MIVTLDDTADNPSFTALVVDSTMVDGALGFKLTNLGGWYGSPPVSTRVTDIPLRDGAFSPVRSYRRAKRMNIEGVTWASTEQTAIEQTWQRIASLSPLGNPMTLTVNDGSGDKMMRVWLDGAPTVLPFAPNRARFQIPLVATDPRKYGPVEETDSGPTGDSPFGLVFPLFASGYLDFGTFSPSGLFYIENTGTAESWPIFKVHGGIDASGFQIVSGSDIVQYSAAVAAGVELTLSPYASGRAVDNGGSDLTYNLTQSDWPSIKPGENRLYVFNPLGVADTNAGLTTLFSPAWW